MRLNALPRALNGRRGILALAAESLDVDDATQARLAGRTH